MHHHAPLILTVKINKEAFLFFSQLRKAYFPAERNFLDAHLTLFHHLPGAEDSILQTIKDVALQQAIITLQVTDVVCIGHGVAYKINSIALVALHDSLKKVWKQWLTPQDQQRLWPHITVQNKVGSYVAHTLQQQLSTNFLPFEIYAKGLCLWEYHKGPWSFIESFPFKGVSSKE